MFFRAVMSPSPAIASPGRIGALCGALLLVGSGLLTAREPTDWRQFRGPDDTSGFLGEGPLDLELDWRVPLGSGYSGIVVAGDRLVTAFADGDGRDVVAAFDVASGRELWRSPLDATFPGQAGAQDGPVATPTIDADEGRVVMVTPRGALCALDLADGHELWRYDLVAEAGALMPEYGFASQPLVVGDVYVVQAETGDKGTVHAVDRRSGRLAWSSFATESRHQSPILAELSGVRQLVVIGNQELGGLDPRTGRELWRFRHTETGMASLAQPVMVDNGILVTQWDAPARLLDVTHRGDTWKVSERWSSRALQRTYSVPVATGGLVYGFGGTFLHVLDAETGRTAWRSRPPGARGLILVDDRLVFLDGAGDVVLGATGGDGWRELARSPALGVDGYTPPSFAAGRVLVRNLEEMAAVRVLQRPGAREAPTSRPPIRGALADLLEELTGDATSRARKKRIARFLSEHETPLREGDRVTFLWNGDAEDVALDGSMLPEGQRALERVVGTDLWFLQLELPAGGAWAYRMVLDLGDPRPDPLNQGTARGLEEGYSLLSTEGWEPGSGPSSTDGPSGSLATRTLSSSTLGNEREIHVYRPAVYERAPLRRFPLLLVVGARTPLAAGFVPTLDRGIADGQIAPAVVAFVSLASWQEAGYQATPALARLLVEELIPELERSERLLTGPGTRVIFGNEGASSAALAAGLAYTGAFGRVATFGLMSQTESEELLRTMIAAADPAASPALRLEFTSSGRHAPALGRSSHHDREWLGEALARAGIAAEISTVPGGPDPVLAGSRYLDLLKFLLPPSVN